MAFQRPQVTAAWPSTPQFTATEDTACVLTNRTLGQSVFYMVDDNPAQVTIANVLEAPEVASGGQQSFQMKSGESLSIVAAPGAPDGFVGLTTLPA